MTTTESFKVLDHGYVKLIGIMGNDEDIVEAARMSTGRGFISWEPYKRCKACDRCVSLTGDEILVVGDWECRHSSYETFPNGDTGMLDTLWRKKHATPFEMGEMVIEVQAPLFVFREWHRHRTQSYNEFSARYSVMPNLHYVPSPERLKALTSANKQAASLEGLVGDELVDFDEMIGRIQEEQQGIYANYERLLEKGAPKESARINTPVSRYSKMRAKTDLRNWLAFLNLRIRPDAQWEIREYAKAVAKLIETHWPKTFGLFEEYDLYAASFSRSELRALRQMLTTRHSLDEVAKEHGLTGRKKAEFEAKIRHGGEEVL